jgi:hypothetical protein
MMVIELQFRGFPTSYDKLLQIGTGKDLVSFLRSYVERDEQEIQRLIAAASQPAAART